MKNQITINFCRALCLTVLLVAFVQITSAQETALDYTFGTNGRVQTDIGSSFDVIRSVAVQADGKILAGGRGGITAGQTRFTIARYFPNGALDGTFGTNGINVINFLDPATGSPLGLSEIKTVLVQPDGKILLVGDGDNKYFVAARLNADGTFDSTFGTNGRAVTLIPGTGNKSVYAAVPQPDGKFVLCSQGIVTSVNRTLFLLARFNTDGTVDTSFGANGFASTRFSDNNSADAIPQTLILQSDGKIITAGWATAPPAFTRGAALARFNSNGTLDATFGTGGLAFDQPGGMIQEIALLPDGKLIAVTTSASSGGFILNRYNANGSLDQTFGEFGRLETIFPGGASNATEVLVQPDGKILAGGYNVQANAWVLARYAANGTFDRTFGTGGRVVVADTSPNNQDPRAYDMTLQPDGKILFGGYQGGDMYLVRLKARNAATQFDFDSDGRADTSVFRPSSGVWYLNRSVDGFSAAQFGVETDKIAPADYDGDGKSDIAVWRDNPGNPEFSYFYIFQSTTNTVRTEQFGTSGDNSRSVGDWDGDGKADLAVYRASTNFFYYRPSFSPGTNFVGIQWGAAGDVPVRGDFDADGKTDAAVFRPSTGVWYIRQSSNGQSLAVQFGAGSDKAVAGDFDGDGKSDIAVFRPSSGVWYIRQSSNNQIRAAQFGLGTDKIVAADYDGDGKTDVAVWRDGVYYILQSGNAQTTAQQFGAPTDTPVASAFVQ
ncbi:MAG: FG-GAP-like repeat-containing protein [Pyrinomonadaceae bacterium]|nr:FG-GAP-like repeat-containing protein [Pyrinomonadaceae bacterium]